MFKFSWAICLQVYILPYCAKNLAKGKLSNFSKGVGNHFKEMFWLWGKTKTCYKLQKKSFKVSSEFTYYTA